MSTSPPVTDMEGAQDRFEAGSRWKVGHASMAPPGAWPAIETSTHLKPAPVHRGRGHWVWELPPRNTFLGSAQAQRLIHVLNTSTVPAGAPRRRPHVLDGNRHQSSPTNGTTCLNSFSLKHSSTREPCPRPRARRPRFTWLGLTRRPAGRVGALSKAAGCWRHISGALEQCRELRIRAVSARPDGARQPVIHSQHPLPAVCSTEFPSKTKSHLRPPRRHPNGPFRPSRAQPKPPRYRRRSPEPLLTLVGRRHQHFLTPQTGWRRLTRQGAGAPLCTHA